MRGWEIITLIAFHASEGLRGCHFLRASRGLLDAVGHGFGHDRPGTDEFGMGRVLNGRLDRLKRRRIMMRHN